MDRAQLLGLAERVEKASGPDRELDCLIWCATSPSHFEYHGGDGVLAVVGGFAARLDWCDMPHPTSSLDAALTLVPEGWRVAYLGEWDNDALRARGPWQAILIRPGQGDCFGPDLSPRCNHAATPALALCAASLRALAAQPHADGGGDV